MTTTVFIYTLNRLGAPGRWSRYVFPFDIDYFTRLNDKLYIRSGNDVLVYDENTLYDYAGDPRQVTYDGLVQWPWLDAGQEGIEKMFDGMDIVGDGSPIVSMGYDQTNPNLFTEDYAVPGDSYPGDLIPIAIMCPSVSVRVKYPGPQKWRLQSANLWVDDQDGRP